MFLVFKLSSDVEEIFISEDLPLELVYSVMHNEYWSLAFHVLDEGWMHVTPLHGDDLPECVVYVELCDREDLF